MSIQNMLKNKKKKTDGAAGDRKNQKFPKKGAVVEEPGRSNGASTREVRPGQLGARALREADEGRQKGEDIDAADVLGGVPDADIEELEAPPQESPRSPGPENQTSADGSSVEISLSGSAVESVHTDVGTSGKKVTDAGSGVYDDTVAHPSQLENQPPPVPEEAKKAEPAPGSKIQHFIAEIRSSRSSVKEKLQRVNSYFKSVYGDLVKKHGKKGAEELAAKASNTPEEGRTPLMRYVLDVISLAQLKKELTQLNRVVESELAKEEQARAVRSLKEDLEERGKAGNKGESEHGQTVNLTPEPESREEEQPSAPLEEEWGFTSEEPPPMVLVSKKRNTAMEDSTTSESGPVKRFFSSRMSWGVALVGGWTAAMAATDGFQRLTEAVNLALNDTATVSTNIVMGTYAAVMGCALAVPEIVRRVKAKKHVRLLEARSTSDQRYSKQREYVITKLTEVLMNNKNVDSQMRSLKQAMGQNEKLLAYLDRFRDDYYQLERVFDDVRMPNKIKKNFDHILAISTTYLLMNKYFEKLAKRLGNRKERTDLFRKLLQENRFFRKKMGELFASSEDGVSWKNNPLYLSLSQSTFSYETAQSEGVMPKLLDELYDDYQAIRQSMGGKAGV
ncbi:hypothetical protein GF318_02290 [Candidatus Micrarchaeota archaeon]|nr:hypothetical protein [Candidatus Micrarchaeota archaeon]